MKHVGKIVTTDQRCVIAFMQIPNRESHALVIPTDTLPPRYEQAVMDVLKSPEGQNEDTFALALSRRLMPDTGKNIFATLHDRALLQAEPVGNIVMLPMPNHPIKLTEVLTALGRSTETAAASPLMEPPVVSDKYNPHTANLAAGDTEQKRAIARNLLLEAKMLEADAQKKREAAYSYDASLRPAKVPDYPPAARAMSQMDTGIIHDPAQLSLDALLADEG